MSGDVGATAVMANGRRMLENAMSIGSMKQFPGLAEVKSVCASFIIPEVVFTMVEQLERMASADRFH